MGVCKLAQSPLLDFERLAGEQRFGAGEGEANSLSK